MNIIIPMAGLGSRFSKAGFTLPKPLIDVAGKPMIIRVMENLMQPEARYILIARKEHMDNNQELINQIKDKFNAVFVPIDRLTEGTACTILFARRYLDADESVVVANSDQIVDDCFSQYIADARNRNLDGSILTFREASLDSKWSYARINSSGLVSEVREKKAISEYATVGIYYFRSAGQLLDSIIQMIIEGDRVNNEFYTCPAYNYMIRQGKRIGIYNIEKSQMHGVGTPEDLSAYIRLIT